MSKKLLFNGCSMVAGDAVTWSNYYPDIDWFDHTHFSRKSHPKYTADEIEIMRLNYVHNLRKTDNLAGQVSKLTELVVDDISIDGNSNQNICMSTIGFLSELSQEERQTYHVCIGWSEHTRRTEWETDHGTFYNINIGHLEATCHANFHNYIKEAIVNRTDIDHTLNYFHNLITLQSYLKSNNITYTFWSTLTGPVSNNIIFQLEKKSVTNLIPYQHKLLFDKKDWLVFNEAYEYPWIGPCWNIEKKSWISDKNKHPNLETVIEFSKKVAEHVLTSINN